MTITSSTLLHIKLKGENRRVTNGMVKTFDMIDVGKTYIIGFLDCIDKTKIFKCLFQVDGYCLTKSTKRCLNREEKEWHISIISYSKYHQHNSIEYNIIVTSAFNNRDYQNTSGISAQRRVRMFISNEFEIVFFDPFDIGQ